MNQKQRVHAALEGKPVDQMPVAVPYVFLYHLDHFNELTGLPQMQSFAWRYMEPQEHTAILKKMVAQADFDIVQPQNGPSRADRENTTIQEIDGQWFMINRRTGERRLLDPVSGHAFDETVNQTQHVFTIAEARERITVTRRETLLAEGENDYLEALVAALGQDHFILSGGLLGAFYSCVEHVGLTNLFRLAIDEPALVDYMCQRNLECNLEYIHVLAAGGGDAIYIDDATTTKDMISRQHYERFSLPYMQAMVSEIHRVGQKAIIIYFGGISDRLDDIASIGADGLIMETSMKGYVNDINDIADKIGKVVTLFGNIDPVKFIQDSTDVELQKEIERQANAGRKARSFILSTGSPLTPGTPLARVRHFIDWGRQQPVDR